MNAVTEWEKSCVTGDAAAKPEFNERQTKGGMKQILLNQP